MQGPFGCPQGCEGKVFVAVEAVEHHLVEVHGAVRGSESPCPPRRKCRHCYPDGPCPVNDGKRW